jgi:hypothetical protein
MALISNLRQQDGIPFKSGCRPYGFVQMKRYDNPASGQSGGKT